MSSLALLIVLFHLATSGLGREADGGAAAHPWQLLMFGQLPVVALFVFTSVPRNPRETVLALTFQAGAALAAAAPVFLLNW